MSEKILGYRILSFGLSFTCIIIAENILQEDQNTETKMEYTEQVSIAQPSPSIQEGKTTILFINANKKLDVAQTTYGAESLEASFELENLGTLYHQERYYSEAEFHYKKALVIQEAKLEPDHPELARSMTKLCILYLDNSHPKKAREMLRKAVSIWEKHPETNDILARISTEKLAMLDTNLSQ